MQVTSDHPLAVITSQDIHPGNIVYLSFFLRLQVLNVSSNKLSSLPPLNPLDDLNNVTELYAANNCLRENAIATIVG